MVRIGIVIGHSFESPGAFNYDLGVGEHHVMMSMGHFLKHYLDEYEEVETIVLDTDEGLYKRAEIMNDWGADIVIELHLNAFNGAVNGTEVLHWHDSSMGAKLAQRIQEGLVGYLDTNDRGLKPIRRGERGWVLLGRTRGVAVLLEPYFIDNTGFAEKELDVRRIRGMAEKVAESIEGFIYENF